MKKSVFLFFIWFVLLTNIFALNGGQLTGFDAETVGRGGADIGIATGGTALVNNPAGITQTGNTKFSLSFGCIFPDRVRSKTYYDISTSYTYKIPIGGMSYLQKINENWFWGMGLFSIGGSVTDYHIENHPAFSSSSQRLKVHTEMRVIKLVPAIAYKINEEWSLGFGLDVAQAMFDLDTPRFTGGFPPFLTAEINEATGYGLGYHFGIMFKPMEKWKIGFLYQSPIRFSDIESIDAHVGIPSFAKDRYRAKIMDFHWPRQVGIGTSYQLTDKLLIGADILWIGWQEVFKSLKIKFYNKQTSNTRLPSDIKDTIPFKWDDQIVYKVGLEYKATDKLTLRLGYNYGKNPIPEETMIPLIPLITEQHISGGFSYKFNKHIKLTLTTNWGIKKHMSSKSNEVTPEFNNSSMEVQGFDIIGDLVFEF